MDASVPAIVINRLPLYLRALDLMVENDQRLTSSQELAEWLGISSAQIRKDLSHFGEFGKQGMGYEVPFLRDQLRSILNVDQLWDMAVVGAGALGHALVNYGGFAHRSFRIRAVFDVDPDKIGQSINGMAIESQTVMVERLQTMEIKIALLAVPVRAAQHVADLLVKGGVRAILSYAPITITVPNGIQLAYIDPVVALQSMTYYLTPVVT